MYMTSYMHQNYALLKRHLFEENNNCCQVILPPGAGKSQIGVLLLEDFASEYDFVYVAKKKVLVDQFLNQKIKEFSLRNPFWAKKRMTEKSFKWNPKIKIYGLCQKSFEAILNSQPDMFAEKKQIIWIIDEFHNLQEKNIPIMKEVLSGKKVFMTGTPIVFKDMDYLGKQVVNVSFAQLKQLQQTYEKTPYVYPKIIQHKLLLAKKHSEPSNMDLEDGDWQDCAEEPVIEAVNTISLQNKFLKVIKLIRQTYEEMGKTWEFGFVCLEMSSDDLCSIAEFIQQKQPEICVRFCACNGPKSPLKYNYTGSFSIAQQLYRDRQKTRQPVLLFSHKVLSEGFDFSDFNFVFFNNYRANQPETIQIMFRGIRSYILNPNEAPRETRLFFAETGNPVIDDKVKCRIHWFNEYMSPMRETITNASIAKTNYEDQEINWDKLIQNLEEILQMLNSNQFPKILANHRIARYLKQKLEKYHSKKYHYLKFIPDSAKNQILGLLDEISQHNHFSDALLESALQEHAARDSTIADSGDVIGVTVCLEDTQVNHIYRKYLIQLFHKLGKTEREITYPDFFENPFDYSALSAEEKIMNLLEKPIYTIEYPIDFVFAKTADKTPLIEFILEKYATLNQLINLPTAEENIDNDIEEIRHEIKAWNVKKQILCSLVADKENKPLMSNQESNYVITQILDKLDEKESYLKTLSKKKKEKKEQPNVLFGYRSPQKTREGIRPEAELWKEFKSRNKLQITIWQQQAQKVPFMANFWFTYTEWASSKLTIESDDFKLIRESKEIVHTKHQSFFREFFKSQLTSEDVSINFLMDILEKFQVNHQHIPRPKCKEYSCPFCLHPFLLEPKKNIKDYLLDFSEQVCARDLLQSEIGESFKCRIKKKNP